MNDQFEAHLKQQVALAVDALQHQALSVGEGRCALMSGSEFYEAKTVLFATGIANTATIKGESELVGKGVSYCATCDRALYKGKTIAIVIHLPGLSMRPTIWLDWQKRRCCSLSIRTAVWICPK